MPLVQQQQHRLQQDVEEQCLLLLLLLEDPCCHPCQTADEQPCQQKKQGWQLRQVPLLLLPQAMPGSWSQPYCTLANRCH
jgi:hypothetical protein